MIKDNEIYSNTLSGIDVTTGKCVMFDVYIHNFFDTRIRKSAIISWSVAPDLSFHLHATRLFELERNLKRNTYGTRC